MYFQVIRLLLSDQVTIRLQEVMLVNSDKSGGPDKSHPSLLLIATGPLSNFKLPVKIRANEQINGASSRTRTVCQLYFTQITVPAVL